MTDTRMGDGLWRALNSLPRGSGVVFRHYELARKERRELFAKTARIAARRRLVLLVAGRDALGRADRHGAVGRKASRNAIRTFAVHDMTQLRKARLAGADAVFVSPVFVTRSHPDARTLGPLRFALLAKTATMPVIALGGMTPHRAKRLRASNIHGWAAIDWWLERDD